MPQSTQILQMNLDDRPILKTLGIPRGLSVSGNAFVSHIYGGKTSLSSRFMASIMDYDRSKPYHCPVTPDNSRGRVYRRMKSFPIDMTTVSVEEFSFIVRSSIAREFRPGNRFQLEYGAEKYEIECHECADLDAERTVVLATKIRDLTKIDEGSVSPLSTLMNSRRMDPLWCIGIVTAMIFLMLMLPGWGDQFGTSHAITNTAQSLIDSFRDAFRR